MHVNDKQSALRFSMLSIHILPVEPYNRGDRTTDGEQASDLTFFISLLKSSLDACEVNDIYIS